MNVDNKDILMLEYTNVCFRNIPIISNCSSCSYGPLCQFSTAYYSITSFQSIVCSIERIPVALVISIFLLASLMNLLAIGTMRRPKPLERGSGIYRLWISIIGQIGLTILVIHLLLEKLNYQWISCYILEYLRKAIHALYDSLTACLVLDRTMIIYQGIAFDKLASCRKAKLVITISIVYHLLSIIYEPFYRHIAYSIDRNWCILKFSHHSFSYYYRILNLVHFILPYGINLIFPFFWIFMLTKHKSTLNANHSTWKNLKKVLSSYRYNIIATYILVLLNTPRLISMFYLTCIEQPWQNTIYIIAYFFSFIPLLINLFIFVLISPTYRPEFFEFLQYMIRYGRRIRYQIA